MPLKPMSRTRASVGRRTAPRRGRPASALLTAVAAALLAAATAGPATARAVDPAPPPPVPTPRQTAQVRPAGEQASEVLSHAHCVLTLHRADAPTARCGAAADTREARSGTLLMTWYTGAAYTGGATDIRGDAGSCDAGGVGVFDISDSLGRSWDHAVSSFRDYGGCAVVEGWDGAGYRGETRIWVGDQPYLGADWDNRISSLVVHG